MNGRKDKKNNFKIWILRIAGTASLIGIWYLAAYLANRGLMIKIPYPHETLVRFIENLEEPGFWKASGVSVLHIICGFAVGSLAGILLGIFSGNFPGFGAFSEPLKHLIRTVPVAAFIIIAWLWVPSKILAGLISGIMVIPILWSHAEAGLISIDKNYDETCKTFRMGPLKALFAVKIPLIMPQIRTGCLTAVGIAWKAGVAAEVISNPTGTIGSLLQGAKSSIDYQQVFAVTLMIILLSILFENILKLVWRERKR